LHYVQARLAASVTAAAAALLLAIGAADSTASASTASASTASASAASPSATRVGSPKTVKISVSDFNSSFTAMKKLKPVTKAGRGLVGVLLPDTTSSDRYTRFDAPYLKRAFSTAGLPSSQLAVQNALGSDATQFSQAQSDIVQGARVLILDPLDSGVGRVIERYAKQHGVDVIDYDRFTLDGTRPYFVSFNQVAVGKAMGQGLVSYDEVMAPYFKSGKWTDVANPSGTWTPALALSEFQQQRSLHPGINTRSRSPESWPRSPACGTYSPATSAAPPTSPTTWRRRGRRPSRSSCGPG
jgi:D-xylose transport system substrate-binding protein